MFLERQTVSRKTPGDGKLEISRVAAEQLQGLPQTLEVELGTHRAPASIEAFNCTCQKVGRAHDHNFLASELLKTLPADTLVELRVTAIRDGEGERTRVSVLPVRHSTG